MILLSDRPVFDWHCLSIGRFSRMLASEDGFDLSRCVLDLPLAGCCCRSDYWRRLSAWIAELVGEPLERLLARVGSAPDTD
jgi:hypothetical protein